MNDDSNFIMSVESKAIDLGFDDVGFCKAHIPPITRKRLIEFIDKGRHGEMSWMSEKLYTRLNPTNMWGEAKTALVVLANYSNDKNPLDFLEKKNNGLISVYAQNKDYHKWIKGRLKNLTSWILSQTRGKAKVFVDTAPLMEKPLAEASGLGWVGKHTNLISKSFGNWTFIGVILFDFELTSKAEPPKGLCGTCSKCIDICPTNAFPQPYKLDARKCISYLTIEHKHHISRKYRSLMGNRIYGCDDCLAICPWNKFAKLSSNIAFKAKKEFNNPSLQKLSKINEVEFKKMFSGSPIKRIGRNQFIRNVLIAMGNSSSKSMLPCVVKLINDDSSLVRVAAIWALGKLSKQRFNIEKRHNFNKERDKDVKKEWMLTYNEIN